MTGRINIIGTGEERLESSLTVKRFDNLTSDIIIYSDEVIINPSYPPVVGNQRKANLFIPHRENLTGNIQIKAKNKMTGSVEVIEPPTYHMELEAEKDSFVRSQIPTLNYGDNQSMVVGYRASDNDIFRSLIKFNTAQIPENSKIQTVKLRLFNRQNNTYTHQVGIYSISTDWQEYGVTWANQPAVKELLDVAQLGAIGYSDIDVTDIVKKWYENPSDNHGFMIRALNESVNQTEQFATRENSVNQPYLDIEYKLDIIYSTGRSSLDSSVFVNAYGESSLVSSINIPIFDADRHLSATIHVTNYNWMMESQLTVNKPSLYSEIIVQQTVEDDLQSGMTVRRSDNKDREAVIQISSPMLVSKMIIRQTDKDEMTGSINVRVYEKGDRTLESFIQVRNWITDSEELEAEIGISRPFVAANIRVRQDDFHDLISQIQVMLKEDIDSNINISKPFIGGNITVKHYDNITGEILVKNTSDIASSIIIPYTNNLKSSINITHANHLSGVIDVMSGYLKSNITIPRHGDSIKMANVVIRVVGINELNSSINVGGDNILGGYVYLF